MFYRINVGTAQGESRGYQWRELQQKLKPCMLLPHMNEQEHKTWHK